jgi:ATP synthase delta (OSCP) subunit.
MERAYAQALQKLLAQEGANEAQIVELLMTRLKAQGRLKLLPKINQELRQLLAREQKPLVEVAHQDESEAALAHAARAGVHASHATVNPSLIQGWRARHGSMLIDHSGKRALIDLYRRITA